MYRSQPWNRVAWRFIGFYPGPFLQVMWGSIVLYKVAVFGVLELNVKLGIGFIQAWGMFRTCLSGLV